MKTKNTKFEINLGFDGSFTVTDKETGNLIRDKKGNVRRFNNRSGARKAITRELRGDFR